MTTVTVAWLQTVVKKEYQGVADLRNTIEDAVANAQTMIGLPLTVNNVVFRESHVPVGN